MRKETVEIWVNAEDVAPGAVVVAYWHASEQPTGMCGNVVFAEPGSDRQFGKTLTRVYKGYGQLRAETGKSPSRGFGQLIGEDSALKIPSNKTKLWLKVED
jgi:hypothetical protein